jgi:tetratricopeptide (TPR) repeat protein
MKYAGEIFAIDGFLSYQRAEALGAVLRSLDDQQKAAMAKLSFNDSRTWPEKPDQVDKKSLPHDVHVAVMTYASEMFSWYAGSADADVYFCPERHGTYFGSFYMKDIPAMGNPNYSISTSLDADSGDGFLAALTPAQREQITGLVELQRPALTEIVKTRRAVSTELRRFIKEEKIDKDAVIQLSKRYGELDGELSYDYAVHFVAVSKTLSAEQKKTLMKLRNLDGYECKGAYIYSRPIPMPTIPNTDFLFTKRDPSEKADQSKAEPGQGTAGAKSADDLLEEANKLEQGQKYIAALKAYEQLAQAKPGSDYERVALKKIDDLKRNPQLRALLADEAASKAAPGEAKRWLMAARVCESAKQPEKAASKCKEILSKYPETTYAQEARRILAPRSQRISREILPGALVRTGQAGGPSFADTYRRMAVPGCGCSGGKRP